MKKTDRRYKSIVVNREVYKLRSPIKAVRVSQISLTAW